MCYFGTLKDLQNIFIVFLQINPPRPMQNIDRLPLFYTQREKNLSNFVFLCVSEIVETKH